MPEHSSGPAGARLIQCLCCQHAAFLIVGHNGGNALNDPINADDREFQPGIAGRISRIAAEKDTIHLVCLQKFYKFLLPAFLITGPAQHELVAKSTTRLLHGTDQTAEKRIVDGRDQKAHNGGFLRV